MLLNVQADFRSGSTVLGANVGAIRDIVVSNLATAFMCLASALVNSGYAFAVEGSLQDGVVSSPRQLPSGQALTERATKAARADALGAPPGSDLKVKWEAGKLSLDAKGASLSEVLRAVSHATGIQVTGAQGLSHRISAHFVKMDLFQALKELLARVDYAIAAGAAGPPGSTPVQGTRVITLPRAAALGPPTSLVTAETNAPAAPEAILQEPEANLQEEPKAEPQERQLAALQAAATDGDREVLHNYLQNPDPTIQAAAFDALAAQGKAAAVEDLWAIVKDTSQPTRLQALALLVQSAGADEQTVMAVLHDALQDPDPAVNAYAVQILAECDDADAMAALR